MVLVIHTGAVAVSAAGRGITAMVRKVATTTRPKAGIEKKIWLVFLTGYSFSLVSGYDVPLGFATEAVEPSRHLYLSPFPEFYPSTLLFCLRASFAQCRLGCACHCTNTSMDSGLPYCDSSIESERTVGPRVAGEPCWLSPRGRQVGSTAGALNQGPERRPVGWESHRAPMCEPERYPTKGAKARHLKGEARYPCQLVGGFCS